jgi:4-hydroxy-tetrahydrodipicolinate synthase
MFPSYRHAVANRRTCTPLGAQYARPAGADARVIWSVSFRTLSVATIFQYFLSIGDTTGIPVMEYNNPATSGVDMGLKL